jgi:hypothetical protein
MAHEAGVEIVRIGEADDAAVAMGTAHGVADGELLESDGFVA